MCPECGQQIAGQHVHPIIAGTLSPEEAAAYWKGRVDAPESWE